MNEMYYPYYLFQGGGQRVPNRFVRSEQRMLSNLNNNGQNAVISGGFNVERGPLGFRRKISNGPIYVIPTQLAQSMVNANGNHGGNTTDSNVDATVGSAEGSPVSSANKASMEFTKFEDLWNRNYPSAYSAARRSLRPANGTSAALDNSYQSAPSNANGVSQTAPSNDTAPSNRDYFSNMSDNQRQMVSYGLNDKYKRRNAGQEKYEWASDVTVTPKSNKNNNRANYSELSQYRAPYIGSQYIPPSNDFTPIQYTIPTFEGNPAGYPMQPNYENVLRKDVVNRYKRNFDDLAEYAPIDGGYNNDFASVYQYGSQVDPRLVYNPPFEFIPVVYRCGGSKRR